MIHTPSMMIKSYSFKHFFSCWRHKWPLKDSQESKDLLSKEKSGANLKICFKKNCITANDRFSKGF